MPAFLWMSGALLSFSLMAIGARELAGGVSTFQILFFRSLIGARFYQIVVGHGRSADHSVLHVPDSTSPGLDAGWA